MLRTPPSLNLPSGSVLIEDADEEIFLCYTRKQRLTSSSAPSGSAAGTSAGLGSHSDKEGVLNVSLVVGNPWSEANVTGSKGGKGGRSKGSRKGKEKEEVEVEVEVHQALDALRHRKGDTGSVLWRISLHLARYLLTQQHFPHPSHPPLLPSLSSSSILELGSGTGFLGLALRSVLSSPSVSWTFTDQLENLPLVVRNLRANGLDPSSSSSSSSGLEIAVEELDWLSESTLFLSPSPTSAPHPPASSSTPPPDLILAADCLYNPSLSAPLAHTILRRAGPNTVVVVASVLREEEALEVFLREWVERGGEEGWRVARVGWEGEGERKVAGELADGQFVVWVGWKKGAEEEDDKR
ncbi:hypothetical protein JCM8547_001260 [Rhodosporidiobolus lusitaniae]